MPFTAANFFEAFFRELGSRGIPFAILHDYEALPERMPSDIDYVVRCADLPRLLPIQQEIARQHGWVLASVVQAKLHAQYAVFFDATDPARFIQLDACGHYVERGCFVLRDDQLLHGCRPHRFLNVPSPASEFAYRLGKALLKGKPLEPQLETLRKLWEADRDGVEGCFQGLFGRDAGSVGDWLRRPSAEWEARLRPQIEARTRFGFADRLRESARTVRRIRRPVGMHLVILGPDGVGKSTLIARLGLPCFRGVTQSHFRPGVLGKSKPAGATVSEPHAQAPRSTLASLAKTVYYFADHWLGYVLKTCPAKVRRDLVIYDRSFEDVFVDPRRYRLAGSSGLARWLSRLLPRPDLTIVLDADPELVHARKPELAVEELRRQRQVLRQLAERSGSWALVSAAATPDQVARAVQDRMLQFLAQRESRRHPG
jgi:thymidylate kinase